MKRLLVVTVCWSAVGLCSLGVAEAAQRTVIVAAGADFEARPSTLSQGSDGQIDGLKWTSWGRKTSTARGTAHYSSERGAPATIAVPVTITAGRLMSCGPWRVYGLLRATWGRSNTGFVPGPFERTLGSCPAQDCGSVVAGSGGFETMWATAVSCRTARAVARKCVRGRRTGWRRKRGRDEVTLAKGRARIELDGRVGGAC